MSDDKPIVKNAIRCGICNAGADRWSWGFQCQAEPGHIADLITGIFSDVVYPSGRLAEIGKLISTKKEKS